MVCNLRGLGLCGMSVILCMSFLGAQAGEGTCSLHRALGLAQGFTDKGQLHGAVQRYAQKASQLLNNQSAVTYADKRCLVKAKEMIKRAEELVSSHGDAFIVHEALLTPSRENAAKEAVSQLNTLIKYYDDVKASCAPATSGVQATIEEVQNAFCVDVHKDLTSLLVQQMRKAMEEDPVGVGTKKQIPEVLDFEKTSVSMAGNDVKSKLGKAPLVSRFEKMFVSPRTTIAAGIGVVALGAGFTVWFLKNQVTGGWKALVRKSS